MRTQADDGIVRIRRWQLGDVDALCEAARESIAEVGAWLPWLHGGYARDDSRAWIESAMSAFDDRVWFAFAVEDSGSRRLFGGVGLNRIDWTHRRANLGYWVRTSATGRGVAPRAARLAAALGRSDLDLLRIEIVCAVDNVRSQRVAEKAGAAREGVLRHRLWLHGQAHDAAMYAIVET